MKKDMNRVVCEFTDEQHELIRRVADSRPIKLMCEKIIIDYMVREGRTLELTNNYRRKIQARQVEQYKTLREIRNQKEDDKQ